jgi:polysaccharide pyruvyl transferase CsaB
MLVLVLGYYGFGNFGDELILAAVQTELAEIDTHAIFVVNDPGQYASMQSSRSMFVDRRDLAGIRRAIHDCDYVMLGGGGLIQDATSLRSSLYYLGIPLLASLQRKGIISYAQGVGPIRRPFIQRLTRLVFGRMALIDVRDEASAYTLRSCGVRKREIHISCDVGLSLLMAQRQVHSNVSCTRPRIVAAVNARFGWTAEETASFLDCLASQYAAQITLVVLFPSMDSSFSRAVRDRLLTTSEVIDSPTAQELVDVCSSSTLIIAGRYHMAAAAVAARSPVVGLAYDAKIAQLAASFKFLSVHRGDSPQRAAALILQSPAAIADEGALDHLVEARSDRIGRLRKLLEQRPA